MKHIKTYKLFESSEKEEIKKTLNDIFLGTKDKEIKVYVEDHDIISVNFARYSVTIGGFSTSKTFLLKDVYDDIQIARRYMSDEGFFLKELSGGVKNNSTIDYYGLLYGFDLYENGLVGKLFEKELVYLELNFSKPFKFTTKNINQF